MVTFENVIELFWQYLSEHNNLSENSDSNFPIDNLTTKKFVVVNNKQNSRSIKDLFYINVRNISELDKYKDIDGFYKIKITFTDGRILVIIYYEYNQMLSDYELILRYFEENFYEEIDSDYEDNEFDSESETSQDSEPDESSEPDEESESESDSNKLYYAIYGYFEDGHNSTVDGWSKSIGYSICISPTPADMHPDDFQSNTNNMTQTLYSEFYYGKTSECFKNGEIDITISDFEPGYSDKLEMKFKMGGYDNLYIQYLDYIKLSNPTREAGPNTNPDEILITRYLSGCHYRYDGSPFFFRLNG